MDIAHWKLTTFNDDSDLLKKVKAGDESCIMILGYDIEPKAQSLEWKPFCYDWADKRKIKTAAVGDTKSVFREM